MRIKLAGLLWLTGLAFAAGDAQGGALGAKPDTKPYTLQQQFMLGGTGGWDYLTLDPATGRLYISRSDHVLVINTQDGALLHTIPDTPGVHGIALAPELGAGFISDGRADTVTAFELKSLAVTATIPVQGHNPDAILYDKASQHVYTFNGRSNDISVIDPLKGAVIATIPAGGKPEFAVADGAGRIFFNVENTAEIGVIDSMASRRLATWPLAHCEEPTGLAVDIAHERLFSVCGNGVMAVTDAASGKPVAQVPIGKGADAAAFDVERALVFSSNGQDGTLSVIHEDTPDRYSLVESVATQKSARTMALDAASHRIYLVAAQFGAAPAASAEQPHPRPPVLEGSFKVLVLGN